MMKASWLRILSALVQVASLISLATPIRAQNVIGARDSFTVRIDSIFAALDRTDAPGCAIGVYRDGRILYARGYGMANLEFGVPLTPRTMFNVASVTKMFTATAVLLLAQEGRFSLEDPLSRHFPEMPPYASGITVRQMLNHISGLHEGFRLTRIAGGDANTVTATDLVRIITRSTESSFPAGTRYEYSNSGYILAGALVNRVSGRSLAAFLQDQVFKPLGMVDTRLFDDHTLIIPRRAQGYRRRGTGFQIYESQFDQSGDGGVWSTIEDFARWDRNWESATVGGRALVDSLVVQGRLRSGTMITYALGIGVGTYRGLRTLEHDGSDRGASATYLRFPDQRLAIACFCNVDTDTDPLAKRVATVYLGPQMLPDTAGAAWTAAFLAVPPAVVPVEQLRWLAGFWRNADAPSSPPILHRALWRWRVEGDSLLDHFGRRLVPLDENRFRVGRGELIVEGEATGTPQRIRYRGGNNTTTWERMDVRPIRAQLAEYAGEYRNDGIETTYALAVDSAGIELRIGGRRLGTLQPSWRDAFLLTAPGGQASLAYSYEFTRDRRGRIDGFVIQGRGLWNLRFQRQR